MYSRIRIKELRPINLEGGYLIDGFPSVGFTSAIATESMIQTSQFSLAGIIDSDSFPPISLIKEGKPNYPTRIFVNDDLKVSVFLSYLTLHESLHRVVAKTMLNWAKKQKIELIVSSMAVKSLDGLEGIVAVGNTDSARIKLKESGLKVLEYGTIPGIPGMLLNEGSMTNQDVIVILFHSDGTGPDFRSSAELCLGMSQLIPGTSCDIPLLQKEAAKAEQSIKETDEESRQLKDSIYR
ncbi:MAG: PAC2 family protein [Thermoproteota archaeon]